MSATRTTTMTVRTFVHELDGGPRTAVRILRTFNEARVEAARLVAGRDGLGAGYEGLSVDWSAIADIVEGDAVTVTAMVSSVRPRRHLVNYVATACNDGGRCSVLVQAHGWTLLSEGHPNGATSVGARSPEVVRP